MGRLTQWIDEGKAIPRVDLRRCGHERCTTQLAKYEDTGLTPDEINALRERDTAKEPEVHTNSDEIRVGSLVIGKGVKAYSCPKCGNMLRGSDNFCPECGQRLKLATETQRPEWRDRMLHTFLGGHHD